MKLANLNLSLVGTRRFQKLSEFGSSPAAEERAAGRPLAVFEEQVNQ